MSNDLVGFVLNDRYQIIKHLGSGGFGVVLQAYDHLLDREVAVKLIQPGYALAPVAVDAFLREARAIGRLDHPNIVTVYDLGVIATEDRQLPFLVMQLAAGGSLADRLRAGPLSLPEARRVLAAVCDALDYAHSRGIIHLDLKPLNILFDKRDSPLVADFGLSKMLEQATRVKADTRAGTLAYMAPEQLFGADAGPFTDVYALGITFYEMLTGELPRRSWDGAVQFDRVLPDDVLATLQTATQTDPGRRFSSVGALVQALTQAAEPGNCTTQQIRKTLDGHQWVDSEPEEFTIVSDSTCKQVDEEIADTRITSIGERFTFEAEELEQREAELAAATTEKQKQELRKRINFLKARNARLAGFWKPRKDDAAAVARGQKALEVLKKLTEPSQHLGHMEGALITDGIGANEQRGYVPLVVNLLDSKKYPVGPVELRHNWRDAQLIGRAMWTVYHGTAPHRMTLNGIPGVVFRRPRKLNGEVSAPIFVAATRNLETYTVYRKGNDDKLLPFSDGYDARKWQVAALFALGQGADVIMEDDTKKQRQNFMLQVLEGAVREEFDIRFGEQFWPFTKLAFKEARYPKAASPENQHQPRATTPPSPSGSSKYPDTAGRNESVEVASPNFNRVADRGTTVDLDRAIADYTEAIRLNPENAEAFNNRGVARAEKGDLDGAIADHTETIRLNSQHASAYTNRGASRADKGDLDGAIEDHTQAIYLDPECALAYYNRGSARYQNGDLDGAIADYTDAIRLSLQDPDAYCNRGVVRADKGDLDGAIADFTEAIRLYPQTPPAYLNRGVSRAKKGDLDGAIADYTDAIRLNPKDAKTYSKRGHVRAEKGDLDGAIEDYTQAIYLEPKYAPAYYSRGVARHQNGDLDGAMADWTQAIQLAPEFTDAYYNRGLARANKGDLDGAIVDFTEAICTDPQYAQAYNNRGNARVQAGDLDGAIADWTQAIQLAPELTNAYYNRGLARANEGDLDGAIVDYTEAIRTDPQYAQAYNDRGIARVQAGDLDGAIADWTQAIQLAPEFADAYYNRGLAREQKNDLDGAITDFTNAIRLNPQNPQTYVRRSVARGRLGDVNGAIADCNEAIQLNPQYADAYDSRGIGYQEKGALERAISDFTEAIRLNPLHAKAYGNRGLVRADIGDLDGAIADFTEAIRLYPQTPPAYLNRGVFRAKKGDLDGAIADFTEVLRLTPQHALAYAMRGFAHYEKGDSGGAVTDLEAYLRLSGDVSDDLREQVDQVLRELKGEI